MKKVLGLSLLCVSMFVQAAELTVGKNIELLVVDGKEVKAESRWQELTSLELKEGQHQVVVRYSGELKKGSKTAMFNSRPYLFDINLTDQTATVTIPRFTTLTQAQAHFRRTPEWQLVQGDQTAQLDAVELRGDGLMAYKDIEGLVAEYNRENGILLAESTVMNITDTVVDVKPDGKVEISGDALAQLKLWYTKATAEEKLAFHQWAAVQGVK